MKRYRSVTAPGHNPPPAPRRRTHRLDDGGDAPLGAEQAVAVQLPAGVHLPLQHVHPHHAGVHGVGVLLHGRRRHRLPGVAAQRGDTQRHTLGF